MHPIKYLHTPTAYRLHVPIYVYKVKELMKLLVILNKNMGLIYQTDQGTIPKHGTFSDDIG